MRIDPKQEAAKALFNIMFDELAEFNLSNYELASLFVTLVAMSAISYEKGAQEQRGILYFVDCSLEKCNQHEIEDACNCLEMSTDLLCNISTTLPNHCKVCNDLLGGGIMPVNPF